jgi:hypothetical protein
MEKEQESEIRSSLRNMSFKTQLKPYRKIRKIQSQSNSFNRNLELKTDSNRREVNSSQRKHTRKNNSLTGSVNYFN